MERFSPASRPEADIRRSGCLDEFCRRIKERRRIGKAIGAAPREVPAIICNALDNGWVFEDFQASKTKENRFSTGQSSWEEEAAKDMLEDHIPFR